MDPRWLICDPPVNSVNGMVSVQYCGMSVASGVFEAELSKLDISVSYISSRKLMDSKICKSFLKWSFFNSAGL